MKLEEGSNHQPYVPVRRVISFFRSDFRVTEITGSESPICHSDGDVK